MPPFPKTVSVTIIPMYQMANSFLVRTIWLQEKKKQLQSVGTQATDVGGDLIFDGNGYIWFSNNTAGSIIQMDPKTGEILRQVPITSADGKIFTRRSKGS